LLSILDAKAASYAFMLPVATPLNAIVFSSGAMSIPQMARAGIVLNLIGVAIFTIISLFIAPTALTLVHCCAGLPVTIRMSGP
tara:strand:- start:221 stop:469 length:249 start_codon:yes stop_codon:yes gene_type:complete